MKIITRFILSFFALTFFSLSAVAATSVTFWHMEGVPHRVDRIQTLIDEFNAANPEIEVNGKKILNKNYTIVNSTLIGTSDRPEVKIDWRIYTKNPDNPLIRDLIIEGLSLARTQKEEFASILNSNDNDINALFKSLEEFSQN